MRTVIFESERINKTVVAIVTKNSVHYVTSADDYWRIKRDESWHFNEDGDDRIKNFFDDPRFQKYVEEELLQAISDFMEGL